MINLIVACDNKDAKLGKYFQDSKKYLLPFLRKQYKLHRISSVNCNKGYINLSMLKYKPNPFVFIAYSHGNEKALRCRSNSYVEKGVNTHNFAKSLFYTTACLTGKELGNDLIKNGCWAFIGYDSETIAFLEDSKKKISINCDNVGIMVFLTEDITIFDAFNKMKNYYTQQIDKALEFEDILFVANLVKMREALVFFGNKKLRKKDLSIP